MRRFQTFSQIPPGPLEVDWSHPLARGLVDCFIPNAGLSIKNYGRDSRMLRPAGTGIFPTAGPGGAGIYGNGATTAYATGGGSPLRPGMRYVTLLTTFSYTVNQTDCRMVSYSKTGAAGTSSYLYIGTRQTTNTGDLRFGVVDNAGATWDMTTSGLGLSDGRPHCAAVSFDLAGDLSPKASRGYVDGREAVWSVAPSNLRANLDTNNTVLCAVRNTGGGVFNGSVYSGMLWLTDGVMPQDMLAWLTSEPYAMLRQTKRRLYYYPSVGPVTFSPAWAVNANWLV